MAKDNFHEKIVLILAFLILNNYLLLSLNFSQLLLKINFIIFLFTLLIFYFRYFFENQFLKIFFLVILFISLGTPLFEWDPRSNYLFHAKRIFYDNSIFSAADKYAQFSNNDYPTLVPAFASSLAVLVGHWNEVFPKLSFSLAFLPPLILTYVFLKDTKYLIFLSIVFFIIGKYLFNGWADGLIAVYFCLSSLLMYLLALSDSDTFKKNLYLYPIVFCFFIILTLIKNEGFVLLLILFITTFCIKLYKGELKKDISILVILSFSFVPILLWKYFCYTNNVGLSVYINTDITHLLTRLVDIKNYQLIAYFLFLNEKFIITLIFFLLSFWINRNKLIFSFVSINLIIYILVIFFVFLQSPVDLYFQLNSTATRVLKSVCFLLAFSGLYNLSNKKITKKIYLSKNFK